jgi:hypothetical protein
VGSEMCIRDRFQPFTDGKLKSFFLLTIPSILI